MPPNTFAKLVEIILEFSPSPRETGKPNKTIRPAISQKKKFRPASGQKNNPQQGGFSNPRGCKASREPSTKACQMGSNNL